MDNNNKSRGLYQKYIVTKADGTPMDDRFFILVPDRDPIALAALATYAYHANHEGYHKLASDIFEWIEPYEAIREAQLAKELEAKALAASDQSGEGEQATSGSVEAAPESRAPLDNAIDASSEPIDPKASPLMGSIRLHDPLDTTFDDDTEDLA